MAAEVPSFAAEAFRGRNRFLLRVALIAALGGFLFGYDTGVISGAQLYIAKDFHLGQFAKQWLVGSLLVGAVVGAIASGYLSDKIGRKYTKVLAGSVYVIGALAGAFATNVVWLNITRFILGLAVGTASFVAVEYISEQTPPRLRGGVTSFNQLMVTTGILVAYLVDYGFEHVGGTWRWMIGLAALPGLALAVGMLTVPHSPRWLVAQGRDDEARSVLSRTRGDDEVDQEIDDIHDVADRARQTSVVGLFTGRLRPLMVTGMLLALFQQIIGVNTVIYYSATILKFTGLSADKSIQRAISVGVTNVVFTVVAILLLDRMGRRPLLIGGTVAATLGLIGLGVFFYEPSLKSTGVIGLAFLLLFIAGFAVGLGPVFWLMISEIYPLGVRSRAMSLATVVNWGANFLVSYYFLSLVDLIGQAGTFWLYAGFGVLAIAYFIWRVPETKDRSLETIEHELGVEPEAEAA